MPNRIIKDSICTSGTVDGLSWFEEVFFYRLIVNVDDYGRFDARPAILKARLFPLKTNVTDKQIEQTLSRLATAGLVSTYMVEAKPILQLLTWAKHQTIRNQKSKYPGADEADETAVEINCTQLNADEPVIQSNPNPNPNPIRDIARARAKPQRHQYGEYSNVLLTDEELSKLQLEFPDWQERVERLSAYMESKGATYKNHLATIRNWARKDSKNDAGRTNRSAEEGRSGTFTLDNGITVTRI